MEPSVQTLPNRIFYALSDDNKLHEINVQNTSMPLRSFVITGLVASDMVAGIDFRPATGQLYAISKQGNLYQINTKTGDQEGKATRIGMSSIDNSLNGGSIGFDFNPTVDRIRVVTSSGQNIWLHPETAATVLGDMALNGPANPMVGAVAYTNSRASVTSTTLYDIDASTNVLYMQVPPNPGVLVKVGDLGLDIEEVGGFDISPDENAAGVYPIASVKVQGKWELDFVNLTSGKLQKLGSFPLNVNIIGIAIPSLPVGYALDNASNMLKIFNPLTGSMFGTKMVTGLPSGVNLEGIDIRPINGKLYALGNNSRIYAIDLASGVSTEQSTLQLMDGTPVLLNGDFFGVDFNPVADRLRVVSNTGQNLRINVMTGVTILDGSLKIGSNMMVPYVTAAAYTNSYPGVTATTLFDIDSKSNLVYKQSPPNDGVLIEPKSLGIDVNTAIGLDIGNFSGTTYAIMMVGGTTSFYTIDLTTGIPTAKYVFSGSVKGLALGFGL